MHIIFICCVSIYEYVSVGYYHWDQVWMNFVLFLSGREESVLIPGFFLITIEEETVTLLLRKIIPLFQTIVLFSNPSTLPKTQNPK